MAASLDYLARSYLWVNEIEALTVATIRGRTLAEVVRIYGGDPASPVGEYTFAEAGALGADPDRPEFHLRVAERDGHVVAVENDGYSGNDPEIARRCATAGGAFFSVYWNVDAYGMLTQAVDGELTARFESLYPLLPEPHAGEVRPAWAVGEQVGAESAWAVCFALMEREGGLAFRREWLGERVAAYRIPDPHRLRGGH